MYKPLPPGGRGGGPLRVLYTSHFGPKTGSQNRGDGGMAGGGGTDANMRRRALPRDTRAAAKAELGLGWIHSETRRTINKASQEGPWCRRGSCRGYSSRCRSGAWAFHSRGPNEERSECQGKEGKGREGVQHFGEDGRRPKTVSKRL